MLFWPEIAIPFPPYVDSAGDLGLAYRFGMGAAQSDTQAANYFQQSLNLSTSADELAWMYEHGQGVPRSEAQAVSLYRRSAAFGSYMANSRLATLNAGP